MNIAQQATQDLGGISKISENQVEFVQSIISRATSAENLMERIEQASATSALHQFVVITIANTIADANGRYRGGYPILADSIMDEQYAKIKKYGQNSYRLSARQLTVIASAIWPYLRKIVEI